MTNGQNENTGRWLMIGAVVVLLLAVGGLSLWAYSLWNQPGPEPTKVVSVEAGPAVRVPSDFCTVTQTDADEGVQGVGDRGERKGVRLVKCTLSPENARTFGIHQALCQVNADLEPILCLGKDRKVVEATKETAEPQRPTVAATEVATAP